MIQQDTTPLAISPGPFRLLTTEKISWTIGENHGIELKSLNPQEQCRQQIKVQQQTQVHPPRPTQCHYRYYIKSKSYVYIEREGGKEGYSK